MSYVRRFDAGALQGKGVPLPGGGVAVPARPTSAGVFEYELGDGRIQREFRPPEEVFHADSLASLAHAPITIDHPSTDVTAENWKQLSHGSISTDVRIEDPYVGVTATIQSFEAISRIDAGELIELSSGYRCKIERAAGSWNGQDYDVIQRKIRYNHVALLPPGHGRHGPDVSLRLDAKDGFSRTARKDVSMPLRIDGKEVSEKDAQAEIDRISRERDESRGRADALATENTTLKTRVAEATDPKRIDAAVKFRARIASAYLACLKRADKDTKKADEEISASGNTDLMLKCLALVAPNFKPEGASEDYIKGAFEASVLPILEEVVGASAPADKPAPATTTSPTPPSAPTDARDSINAVRTPPAPATAAPVATPEKTTDDIRKDHAEKSQNAYKLPLRATVRARA